MTEQQLVERLLDQLDQLAEDVDDAELEEAIEDGDTERVLDILELNAEGRSYALIYALLVALLKAMFDAHARALAERYGVPYDPTDPSANEAVRVVARDAALTMIRESRETVRGVLSRNVGLGAAALGSMVIASMWSLDRHVAAVDSQRARMIESGVSESTVNRIAGASLRRYVRHRARLVGGWVITAIAAASWRFIWRFLAKMGSMTNLGFRWFTQRDERVCRICGPLHNKTRTLDGNWPDGGEDPPRHSLCRCEIKGEGLR